MLNWVFDLLGGLVFCEWKNSRLRNCSNWWYL